MWKNALFSVLSVNFVSENGCAGCCGKGTVELPSVVKANNSICSGKYFCGNTTFFAADNEEYRL